MLQKIVMRNFGPYYGQNTLKLSEDKGTPVTIVSGPGASGKATIIRAIRWCLFGLQVGEILNSDAKSNAKTGDTISVGVELYFQHKGKTLALKRIQSYVRKEEAVVENNIFLSFNGLECTEDQFLAIADRIVPEQLFQLYCWTEKMFMRGMGPGLLECLESAYSLYCDKKHLTQSDYSFHDFMAAIMRIAEKYYAKRSGKFGDINLIWDDGFYLIYKIEDVLIEGEFPEEERHVLTAAVAVACQVFCVENDLLWGCMPVIVEEPLRIYPLSSKDVYLYLRYMPDSQTLFLVGEYGITSIKSLFKPLSMYIYVLEYDKEKQRTKISYAK